MGSEMCIRDRNFYKVLLDAEGNLVETYNSITKPNSKKITSKIEQVLEKNSL